MQAHREVSPAIHYWGTPVVLISTLNEDGSVNVAPISSAWWLGWSCMLGFDASSQTVINLARERECVVNLVGVENVDAVNSLALTTGRSPIPAHKRVLGYRHVADKLERAELSTVPSSSVRAPRLRDCPVHLEATVHRIAPFGDSDPRMAVAACSVELRIVRTHVAEDLLRADDKIDADAWRPLLMSFRGLFARGERLPSALERGDEDRYAPWKGGPLLRWASTMWGLGSRARARKVLDGGHATTEGDIAEEAPRGEVAGHG